MDFLDFVQAIVDGVQVTRIVAVKLIGAGDDGNHGAEHDHRQHQPARDRSIVPGDIDHATGWISAGSGCGQRFFDSFRPLSLFLMRPLLSVPGLCVFC